MEATPQAELAQEVLHQDQPVQTGLTDLNDSAQAPIQETPEEAPAPPSPPIQFVEPEVPLPKIVRQMVVGDTPAEATVATEEVIRPPRNARERAEAEHHRIVQERARQLQARVDRSNKPKPAPVPPPIPPALLDQRHAEMEAGRKMVAHHNSLKALRPQPKANSNEGTTTPVFRPGDYIPDQRKGQGNVSAQPVG